jgi:putative hydrolase of the HAD superfamily
MVDMVLWDFDGTLAYRSGLWRSALIEALDLVAPGHGRTPADIRPGLRSGFPWHRPDIGHPAGHTAAEWWDRLWQLFVAAYEIAGIDADTARAAAARVRECYLDPRGWSVYDDSEAALAKVARHGIRQMIVSNHVPELPGLVADLGLGHYFDAVLTSAVVGWEKPNPRMFAAARAAAGSPDRMWMIGDNERADIAGAGAVGIPGILVRADGATLSDAIAAVFDATPRGVA